MAVPKHKTSKSKRDKRRTHQKVDALNLSTCSQCGEAKIPHNVCPSCGYYKERPVVVSKEE
ncbi:MAG: 50S ribosomal protein L32 [Pseudomonadota bacterium]|nr:50S ribosomal protein L32 [Pseudomonadota bacterium]MBU1397785.1 50S ribosomal protein L32 [Pseudomonadota bacterium]MBU1570794.1 50S ribosomal protein L32 [Pseudomonadota bacterium]